MQICDIRLTTSEIGFACEIFSSKMLRNKKYPQPGLRIFFYINVPKGHISHCVSNISHFPREIYHFPVRENITGVAMIPYRNRLLGELSLFFKRIFFDIVKADLSGKEKSESDGDEGIGKHLRARAQNPRPLP